MYIVILGNAISERERGEKSLGWSFVNLQSRARSSSFKHAAARRQQLTRLYFYYYFCSSDDYKVNKS